VLLADLQNWFYQILIPLEWWPWFCAHIAASRREFHQVCLTLSVGLGISTLIDHFLAVAIDRYALLLLHSPGCKIVDSSTNLGAGSFPGRQVVRPPTPGTHAHDLALVPVWVGRAAGQAPKTEAPRKSLVATCCYPMISCSASLQPEKFVGYLWFIHETNMQTQPKVKVFAVSSCG
jgi:hypothetical protein